MNNTMRERLIAEIAALEAQVATCEHTLHAAPIGCPYCKRDRRYIALLTDVALVLVSSLPSMPVWKCKACGCLWRDNLDDTVSLLNAEQRSCASCEHTPTRDACAIHWLPMESATSPNAEASAVDAASSVGAHTSSSLVLSSSSLRTLVEQKIAKWRKQANHERKFTGPFGGTAIARGVAGIFDNCADELAALLSPIEHEIAELREAKNLPPLQSSCCHSFGEWCDNCVGAVVREFNELRKRLSPVAVEDTHEDTATRTGDDGLSTSSSTAFANEKACTHEWCIERDEMDPKCSCECHQPASLIAKMRERGINPGIVAHAYGWTIADDGELHGLVAGDHGYEPSGLRLDSWTQEWIKKLESATPLNANKKSEKPNESGV
jgi:hypothetical protein